jgi:hypothetical protein
MKISDFRGYAGVTIAAALLAGCGGPQTATPAVQQEGSSVGVTFPLVAGKLSGERFLSPGSSAGSCGPTRRGWKLHFYAPAGGLGKATGPYAGNYTVSGYYFFRQPNHMFLAESFALYYGKRTIRRIVGSVTKSWTETLTSCPIGGFVVKDAAYSARHSQGSTELDWGHRTTFWETFK